MISNERQYKITKNQLKFIQKAIVNFDLHNVAKNVGSSILAQAELEGLMSEENILTKQIEEYEFLKSSPKVIIKTSSLSELPKIMIQARIVQNLTQKDLGKIIGVKEQQIQRYESEYYATASLKRLIEIADALNISIDKYAEINKNHYEVEANWSNVVDWTSFPLKEMYRRGWFEGFCESFNNIIGREAELVKKFVFSALNKEPLLSLNKLKVRSDSKVNHYALFAWKCRIVSLSKTQKLEKSFDKKFLGDEWINNLVKLSTFPDGPIKAKKFLNEIGIHLVFESHMSGTYLDGAAFLIGEIPIIGMTLRFDRMDNFWFVLLHELMHIRHHLEVGGLDSIYDDLNVNLNETLEIETDEFSSNALIPDYEWKYSLAKFTRSDESITKLARKLGISKAIIGGRIRFESNNYTILNDLIGQGEVRKLFPDVIFGL